MFTKTSKTVYGLRTKSVDLKLESSEIESLEAAYVTQPVLATMPPAQPRAAARA